MAYKTTITHSGTSAVIDAASGALKVMLYATASGTTTATAVLCDENGILLTSGIN